VRPDRRLPVTPDLVDALRRRVARRPVAFPLSAPTWPGTVARPPVEKTLGVDYDSDWARRYPARMARLVVQDVLAGPLVRAIARPTVSGLDRIAHLEEPVIFAANHASHVDAPLLLSVIPSRWRDDMFVAGAADYFFDTRVKATAFAFLLNAVPIERQRVSRESAGRVEELLEDGWSLLIFPEGGRSVDGWGQPHRAGAAWLAARTGRPIVPVHVSGTRDILPKGGNRIRPGRTRITFGRPLRCEVGGGSGAARALATRLEQEIAALADEHATDWWTARRRAASGSTPALTGPDAGAWRRAWALGAKDGRERGDGWDGSGRRGDGRSRDRGRGGRTRDGRRGDGGRWPAG
jgi:1-acyl-sn-glycerol-3-phosphate acyltransferase